MCGIVGYVSKKTLVGDEFLRAIRTLNKRGPDSYGQITLKTPYGEAALGHTRLAILDLSSAADQPMFSYDKRYVIVFNGEIYNFQEIKLELRNRGYQFNSTSDTEVLLNAYIEFGPKILERLEGMFALAILDTLENNIFIARDPYGEKPLYYYYNNENFAFASEITPLLEINNIKNCVTLNQNSILQYYIFGSRSWRILT